MLRDIWTAMKLGIGLLVGLMIWQHRDDVRSAFQSAAAGAQEIVKSAEPSSEMRMMLGIRKWLRRHMADPNAEVLSIGTVMRFKGGPAAMCSIRGRNVFNGPIIVEYLFEFDGAGDDVVVATSVKEWMKIYGAARAVDGRANDYSLMRAELIARHELWQYEK